MNDESPAVTEVKGGLDVLELVKRNLTWARRFATALQLVGISVCLYSIGWDLWQHQANWAALLTAVVALNGVVLYLIHERNARFEVWKKHKFEIHAARIRNSEQASRHNEAMIEQLKKGMVNISQMFAGGGGPTPTH